MDTKPGVGAVRGPLGARFGIVGAIARQSAYARKINIPIQVIEAQANPRLLNIQYLVGFC